MTTFLLKTIVSAVLGWIPAALMLVVLGGCEKAQEPVVDPRAFSFWVVPF